MSKGDESTTESNSTGLSSRRRKLLGALGAGTVAGLAGCSGGDGDGGDDPTATETETGDTTDGTTGTTSGTDTTQGTTEAAGYPNASYSMHIGEAVDESNWYFEGARGNTPRNLYPWCAARLGTSDYEGDGVVKGLLAEDWEINDEEFTVTIKESYWSNGDQLMAEDIVIGEKHALYDRERSPATVAEEGDPSSFWEAIEDITWDGRTFTFHAVEDFFGKFNQDTILYNRMISLGGMSSIFSQSSEDARNTLDELEALDDPYGEDSETVDDILNVDATETEIPTYDPTEWVVSGPFQVDEQLSDQVRLVPNEQHWSHLNDNINFGKMDFRPMANANVVWTGIQQNILDGINALGDVPPDNVVESFPDNMNYHRYGGDFFDGLALNRHRAESLGNVRVRHAFQHALNQERIVGAGGDISSGPLQNPPGLQGPNWNQYVDQSTADQFGQFEHDPERANTLLQEAGYTKENQTWMDSDGNPLSYELLTSANNIATETSIVADLSSIGLNVSLSKQSSTIVSDRVDTGDYQLTLSGWWGGDLEGFYTRSIWQSTRNYLMNPPWTYQDAVDWAQDKDDIEITENDSFQYLDGPIMDYISPKSNTDHPFTVEAPPVGEFNYDADMQTYNIGWNAFAVGQSLSPEMYAQVKTEDYWLWNWNLFQAPFQKGYSIAYQDHGDWNAPEGDGGPYEQDSDPITRLAKLGEIGATTDDA